MPVGENLIRFNKEQEYVLPDFETEGLNLFYSRPWQLSYSIFTLDKNILKKDFYILWPDLRISEEAKRITRFDYAKYKSLAVSPQEVIKDFEPIISNPKYKIVYQNGIRFDSMIYQILRRAVGLKPDYSFLPRCYDTTAMAKVWKKNFKINTVNLLGDQFKLMDLVEKGLKTSLGTLGKELKIDFNEEGLHDAATDIDLNMAVFRKLVWSIEI